MTIGGESTRPADRPERRSLTCRAILFDLDGVLVDSGACIARVWTEWALRNGLDPATIRSLSHGRRAAEVVAAASSLHPGFDVAREEAALEWAESHETVGLESIPEAGELLCRLPLGSWAVVTSGTRGVAMHRLRHVGLPIPAILVAAGDVVRGKPDPEGYVAAAELLGVPPGECLVIEDSLAGIQAAAAAGMRSVAVATSPPDDWPCRPDGWVTHLSEIGVQADGGTILVRLA